MPASQIFLIIVSGLGVIHGTFLAIFLWLYKKGNLTANKFLSLLLLVLSFRIGKSVFLEFLDDLDVRLIFIGLGTMMIIGPLFYLYCKSCIDKTFRFSKMQALHFIPAAFGVGFGLWLEESFLYSLPKFLVGLLFLSYYGHYITYLLVSNSYISKKRKEGLNDTTFNLLRLLFYGLLVIWIAYVLNLFDDLIPYVVGPVLYSVVAYVISFIVIQKGYIQQLDHTKYKQLLSQMSKLKTCSIKSGRS